MIPEVINEHSRDIISKLLALRLKNAHINIKEVRIVSSILYDGSLNTTERLCDEITSNLEGDISKILVPVNFCSMRWVRIIAVKSAGGVKLTYIDPEQQKIPTFLKEQLILQMAINYPEYQVSVTEQELKSQKLRNHNGVEAIENFIWHLTGNCLSQKKAVEFYSCVLRKDLAMMVQDMKQIDSIGVGTEFYFDHG
jgi:hypothetical protein